jgi:lipopolysaccharide/colanic/teichoic acid biosynthesis glycosyltransferase
MDKELLASDISINNSTKNQVQPEIIWLGFQNGLGQLVKNYPLSLFNTNNKDFLNTFKAYNYIELVSEHNGGNPRGLVVIVNARFLLEDDFLIVRSLAENENLQNIPVIAISDDIDQLNPSFFLENGIDDCYSAPVSWEDLELRMKFFLQYKSELRNRKEKFHSSFNFELPLGKRIFDLVMAGGLLLVLSPLLLLIIIMIKIESRGPVFYKSKRVGTGYRTFEFLKFRSMFVGADAKLAQLAAEGGNQYGSSTFVKIKNDPRITSVGKFIRKTSLDELPQFINVLRGEMSIVGNRPLPVYEAEQLTKDEWAPRFLAPAGLTGLWQVTKRGKDNMSTEERIGLDIAYAKRYSLLYDLKIILKTLPAMIQKENV